MATTSLAATVVSFLGDADCSSSWHDADTILLCPHVPLQTFLPPGYLSSPPKLLISANPHGLNNGVFMLQVSSWAIDLFTAVLSYPMHQPNVSLRFRDQSALENVLDWDGNGYGRGNVVDETITGNGQSFRSEWIEVPMRWFNAWLPDTDGVDAESEDDSSEPHTSHIFQARPGDLLVHFAGIPDKEERMEPWLRRAERTQRGVGDWVRGSVVEDEVAAWWAERVKERGGA